MIETQIVFYKNKSEMTKGINKWQKAGWTVVSTEVVPQGFGAAKTCCLGCLFLPLALLGRKPEQYKVMYQRGKPENTQINPGNQVQSAPITYGGEPPPPTNETPSTPVSSSVPPSPNK
jgi:hypothetical protein